MELQHSISLCKAEFKTHLEQDMVHFQQHQQQIIQRQMNMHNTLEM